MSGRRGRLPRFGGASLLRLAILSSLSLLGLSIGTPAAVAAVAAGAGSASESLTEANRLLQSGQYYTAARFAYAATESGRGGPQVSEAYATVTLALIRAGLFQSSTYFFLKTLETKQKPAIRRVLTQIETLFDRVGVDAFRDYLIRFTEYSDYDVLNKSAYLFALGKVALLRDDQNKAIQYLNSVSTSSPLYPRALQLRGTALAIQNRVDEALEDFKECQENSRLVVRDRDATSARRRLEEGEARDLGNRCLASRARVYYQAERFEEAEQLYNLIPKESLVWPDILFEEAWNAFSKREFNRSLGKLVTYKSPLLKSMLNSEIDILRAQGYLSLCLYDDTEAVLNEFTTNFNDVGRAVKRFVEENETNLPSFYALGLQAFRAPRTSPNPLHRMANRFIRGPYFASIVQADAEISAERQAVTSMARLSGSPENSGMTAFLREVLRFRERTNRSLGGAFVKNSLIDHHAQLVADFEKVSFIRIEMISRQKEKIIRQAKSATAEREERARGNVLPIRHDNQMFWIFNGEYWADELGDYVFGLRSECAG